MMNLRFAVWSCFVCLFAVTVGCAKTEINAVPTVAPEPEPVIVVPRVYEANAEQLLAARLPIDQSSQGWIRLFDGYTLYGWEIAGAADWSIKNETIVVSGGGDSLLCTSMIWQNYELELEARADPTTNSGIFVRTPLEPEQPGVDCYEINIRDQDPNFPTGSLVNGKKSTFDVAKSVGDWRTYHLTVEGKKVTVKIDGEEVCTFVDPTDGLSAGRIGLQHRFGKVEFRNIRLRPLGLNSLLDQELSQWKRYPEMPGKYSVNQAGWLHIEGGLAQLESAELYRDFVLLAQYKLVSAKMNSGIFFRCIPGDQMMGYECQLSNQFKDDNPLTPADCGTGGIFRRQDARLVAGEPNQWASVLLVVSGPSMAAWVNGVQVSNWYDDRSAHENPRKGCRLEAGTLMLQGHDKSTDAWIKKLQIGET